MPWLARRNRVIAVDLPGFGASDKPLDVRYGFPLYESALDGFVEALGIEVYGLVVHDLGGPIGLHWMLDRPGRIARLALLNTLVYPEFSQAVVAFVRACSTPGQREQITSPAGLEEVLRQGLADPTRLTSETLAATLEPFQSPSARQALAAAGVGLARRGFEEIARELPVVKIPVRIVYGEQDRLLPDVAETMTRVASDLPQAEVTALPACGHFLQEEAPGQVGELLGRFFSH
jgi:haloalkane dehalogenase